MLAAIASSSAVTERDRIAAAKALAGVGDGRGADALAALAADSANSDPYRLKAAKELAGIGDVRGFSSLGLLIASPKMSSWRSQEALGILSGMTSPSVAEMLVSRAVSPETPARMRREAAEALVDIGDPRAPSLTAEIASDPAVAPTWPTSDLTITGSRSLPLDP